MMLSDVAKVAQRFQRSIRIDTDLNSTVALDGFICHESSHIVLETMGRLITESKQRAFTWTGPYGGGKSSLALALTAMVSHNAKHRKQIFNRLDKPTTLRKALTVSKEGWLVVPVIGRRNNPVEDIRAAVSKAIMAEPGRAHTKKRKIDVTGRDVIDRLTDEAIARTSNGVLLIIDEMGKFLECAQNDTIDIHFFQELAEAANRCEGKLIILGVLHQSFEQYSRRLGRETQDEWAKVQGRFIDIPIITAVDEVIGLIGRAILHAPEQQIDQKISKAIAAAIAKRRPGSPPNLPDRLDACWPLHPVTAVLLGPISRRQYAQNERSVFGFLGSVEPFGFQTFLQETKATAKTLFGPARLWDYLRTNLEPAIMASPDGHRWAQSVEAIERCEMRGSPLHNRLAKTIAIIDLFRNGSGIMAEQSILRCCGGEAKAHEINTALKDLSTWSIIAFRKHLNAWAIYAGSDFDMHSAIETAKARSPLLNFHKLSRLASMSPLLAKAHYYRTGTLRWFKTSLVTLSDCERTAANFEPSEEGASGQFLLVIPSQQDTNQACRDICATASLKTNNYPVAIGLARNARLLCDLGLELTALEDVQRNNPELEGDAVARRELRARLTATSAHLEEALRTAFSEAEWYIGGICKKPLDEWPLSRLVSTLANDTFKHAPIIHSELINRIKPSSNSQAAIRQLLYHMINNADSEHLGIKGFKTERGLYSTVLRATGLHDKKLERWRFLTPDAQHPTGRSFIAMWKNATALLRSVKKPIPLSNLYDLWNSPPFGIKQGVLPVIAMAFILAQRDVIAIYVEDMFQPELNDVIADKLLQDPHQIKLRRVSLGPQSKRYLANLAETIRQQVGYSPQPDALSIARALVRFSFAQPPWSRRTKLISQVSQQVRHVLLHASDPHQTLFVDLPTILGEEPQTQRYKLAETLKELGEAYPRMLSDLQQRMLKALDHKSGDNFVSLRKRAETVSGLSGDFRLDAFATRLMEFKGTEKDMESIAGLAVNKPPRDWSDREPEEAALVLAQFALKFRHAEVLASIKDRSPTRYALGIVFGTGEHGRTLMKSFDIGAEASAEVEALATELMNTLNVNSTDNHLVLAALAHVGSQLLEQEHEVENSKISQETMT